MLSLYLCGCFSLDTIPNVSSWCVTTHLSRLRCPHFQDAALDLVQSLRLLWISAPGSCLNAWPPASFPLKAPWRSLSKTQILSCHSLLKIASRNDPSINALRALPCSQEDIQSLQMELKACSPLVSPNSALFSPDSPAQEICPSYIALIP